MLDKALNIVKAVAEKTDRVILFHSGSGKDSIALLDLLYPYFREIVVVYMYAIKDLAHRYLSYARQKYPRAKIVQTPHYAVYSFRKYGTLGCKVIEGQRKHSLSDIDNMIRQKTGIEWFCFGFKQSDGMNRQYLRAKMAKTP